jgi:glycine/D-amino acid oxidase-like deaminating enzyme
MTGGESNPLIERAAISDSGSIGRRAFIKTAGAFVGMSSAGLGSAALGQFSAQAKAALSEFRPFGRLTPLIPLVTQANCISRITVCLRPFRAAGPRLEAERIGDKTIVHNYGHGGSGWSLSWGYATRATEMALNAAGGNRKIGVLGAGIIGLTSALLLQRAGAQVTIYTKELTPNSRSLRATGNWNPDSRVALASAVSPDFPENWEKMARTSFAYHRQYVRMPGNLAELTDRWILNDQLDTSHSDEIERDLEYSAQNHDLVQLNRRVSNLLPKPILQSPNVSPFPTLSVTRSKSITFNIAAYSTQVLREFKEAGGKIVIREFNSPQELSEVGEQVIVNCPGYDARRLWKDESIIPIRGQITWLAPQEGVHYGLMYKELFVLARRDGVVLQYNGESDSWNNANEEPDRAAAERTVAMLQELFSRMRVKPTNIDP